MLVEWVFGVIDFFLNMENMMKYFIKVLFDVIVFFGFYDEIFLDIVQWVMYMVLGVDLLGEDIGSKLNNMMMLYMELVGVN